MAARPPLFPSPSMLVIRKAMTQGLFGDSRMWKLVAFAIIARRMLLKIMDTEPRLVAIEKIRPGETLILRGVTGKAPKGS